MGIMGALTGNASKVDNGKLQEEYGRLLASDESIYAGYAVMRDTFLFTNRRFILIDKQGLTGSKIEYQSIPYKSISHYAVETAGAFADDAELKLWVGSNPHPIKKEFRKGVDVYEIQALLTAFVAR